MWQNAAVKDGRPVVVALFRPLTGHERSLISELLEPLTSELDEELDRVRALLEP